MSTIKYLFWILVAFNFLDVGTTYLILQAGGYEANPLIDLFIQQFGAIPGMIIMKAGPLTLLWYVIEYRIKASTKLVTALMYIPVIAYGALIIYSTTLLYNITGAPL